MSEQSRYFVDKGGWRFRVRASDGECFKAAPIRWDRTSIDLGMLERDANTIETDEHGQPLPESSDAPAYSSKEACLLDWPGPERTPEEREKAMTAYEEPSVEPAPVRGDEYPKGYIKDTTKALPPSEFHRYGEGKAHTEQLPDAEGTCPKTGPKQPCVPCLTLTGSQLREALELCGDNDSRVTISLREDFVDSETLERQPGGLYVHYTDDPQEGVFGPLDGIASPAPAPGAGSVEERLQLAAEINAAAKEAFAKGETLDRLSSLPDDFKPRYPLKIDPLIYNHLTTTFTKEDWLALAAAATDQAS